MLLVKTRLAPSPIEGLGLFADQDIPEGTPVWRFNPVLDRLVDPRDFEKFSAVELTFLDRYAYLSARLGKYVVCVDDARYINHADAPNLAESALPGEDEGVDVAARDIKKGEELTSDYRAFDKEHFRKLSGH